MTRKNRIGLISLGALAGIIVFPEIPSLAITDVFVSSAEARVGRPRTPMSYAGVARRTTRRAVAVGAAAGAYYAYPSAAYGSGCVQVVDSYGRIVYRCR